MVDYVAHDLMEMVRFHPLPIIIKGEKDERNRI